MLADLMVIMTVYVCFRCVVTIAQPTSSFRGHVAHTVVICAALLTMATAAFLTYYTFDQMHDAEQQLREYQQREGRRK